MDLIMMIVVMIILISVPIFALFFFRGKHKLPPGPLGFPIIGNLYQWDTTHLPAYLWNLSSKYGPIMFMRLGSLQTIIISSAKMAKEVLKTNDLQFAGRPKMLGPQTFSYQHRDVTFTPYGNYWREMRKISVIHLFNSKRVTQFRPVREDEVSHMVEKVSKLASASKAANLSDIIMMLFCNNICRVAFSRRCEDEDNQESQQVQDLSGHPTRFHYFLAEFQAMSSGFFFTDFFPLLRWVDKLTGKNRRLQKIFNKTDKFYQELIDQHLHPKPKAETEAEEVDQKREDIIDVLLDIQKSGEAKFNLTWDNIKAVLMDVFVAGTDTSAATLVWAMTNLMKHPETMKKAQEEVRSVVKDRGFVDEDDLDNLPYLKAVVKETFRMQPPAPLVIRSTIEDCTIDGYEIPAKALVYINAFAIGRDTEVWDKPLEFNPERFLGSNRNSSVDFHGQDFELLPFGSGRRICPAITMAMPTLELALASLLYKFNWSMPLGLTCQDLDYDIHPGLTMHKKNPLMLVPSFFIWI